MFLERKFDAYVNISSKFVLLVNTSFNGIRLRLDCTTLIVAFSNDLTDVKCHKKRSNFAVRDFTVR